MISLLLPASFLGRLFGMLYPISRAACSTFCIVSFEKETLYFLFSTMDTVAWDTPAAFAISVDVTFFFMLKLL